MKRSWSMTSGWLVTAALVLCAAMLLLPATRAFAYNEASGTPYPDPLGVVDAGCYDCHGGESNVAPFGKGAHGGYTTGSVSCVVCHSVHAAPADSAILLPRATVTATCEMCHDGTGGRSVYGAIAAKYGTQPGSQHRVELTSLVPGGDASTGATRTATFSGPGGTLSCSDCHSPHGSDTVTAFPGERRRVPYPSPSAEASQQLLSNRLLRQHPGNATDTAVADYGSEWCVTCHQGRMKGAAGAVNDHPGDYGTDFKYGNVAKLSTDASTTSTTMGPLGQDNRGYLMPDRSDPPSRTVQQGTHKPICQQCHEDSRFVGTMAGNEASAATFLASLDGTGTGGNPEFQNFPHETENDHLLVETGDDLCLNCHAQP